MRTPALPVSSFDHQNWHCDIELTGTSADGCWAGHAQLYRNGDTDFSAL